MPGYVHIELTGQLSPCYWDSIWSALNAPLGCRIWGFTGTWCSMLGAVQITLLYYHVCITVAVFPCPWSLLRCPEHLFSFCHGHLANEIEAQSRTYFTPFMHILGLNPSKERLFKLHIIIICRQNVSLYCTKSWKNSCAVCEKTCLRFFFFFLIHTCHIHQLVFHAGKWGWAICVMG